MEECINSICNQTYNNLQIILVDDGSTDNSFNICKLFDEHDERILLIHKENGGLVSARKAGAAVAIGDYISFGEDAACSFSCMLSASTIISLDYAPYHYRQREGSIVQSQNEISDDNFIEIYILQEDLDAVRAGNRGGRTLKNAQDGSDKIVADENEYAVPPANS